MRIAVMDTNVFNTIIAAVKGAVSTSVAKPMYGHMQPAILEFRGPIAPITIKTNREDVKMVLPVRIKEADNGSDGG